MSVADNYESRRRHLAEEIDRQRGALGRAYHHLAQPLHYVETGMKGFGFLRRNQWIFLAAPTVFSLGSSLFGLFRSRGKKVEAPVRRAPAKIVEAEVELPKGKLGKARRLFRTGLGYAMEAFQLYRRIRPYL
jgi:hypothetical protein